MTTIEPERRLDQNEIETFWAIAAKTAEPGSQARITISRDYSQPTVARFRTEPVNCFDQPPRGHNDLIRCVRIDRAADC
jgi:hypothetical protein